MNFSCSDLNWNVWGPLLLIAHQGGILDDPALPDKYRSQSKETEGQECHIERIYIHTWLKLTQDVTIYNDGRSPFSWISWGKHYLEGQRVLVSSQLRYLDPWVDKVCFYAQTYPWNRGNFDRWRSTETCWQYCKTSEENTLSAHLFPWTLTS